MYGRGGTSKSFTVKEVFDKHCPEKYRYIQGGCTPGGFLDLLQENSMENDNQHIVIDDVNELVKSLRNLQHFLEATDHKPNNVRTVTYKKGGKEIKTHFDKGIVLISNVELNAHNNEVLQALDDRIFTHEHNPTDGELWTLIYYIADHSEKPKEWLGVADFLFEICIRVFRKTDYTIIQR